MSVSEIHAYLESEVSASLAHLLRRVGLSEYADFECERIQDTATFTEVRVEELRADLLFRLLGPRPAVLIIEIQRRIDRSKPTTWARYVLAAYERHQVPVHLLVVTDNRAVARWASKPIAIFGDHNIRPLVLGPDDVPQELNADEISEDLNFALLTAIILRRQPSAPMILGQLWHEIHDRLVSHRVEGPQLERYLGIIRVLATDDWWQTHVESSMEVRSFFDQLRAQGEARGEARGKAEARAQLKASALEAVRLAAPELVSDVSKLDDAEQILQRLNEHLRTRGH